MIPTRPHPVPSAGLHVVRAPSLEDLGDVLAQRWAVPPTNIFDLDVVVVPSPGVQRWLSQGLATRAGDEGICTGIEFLTWPAVDQRIRGAAGDPWEPARLVWALHEVVGADAADRRLDHLRRHLDASREPYSALDRIANRFADYVEWRPEMIRAWQGGRDVDGRGAPLGFDAWQAHLWRLLCARIGDPDPLEAHQQTCAGLAAGFSDPLPSRVAVFSPFSLTPRKVDLLTALGVRHQVDVLLLTAAPDLWGAATEATRGPTGARQQASHPLNRLLGRQDAELAALVRTTIPDSHLAGALRSTPDTLLGWLQHDLSVDRRPPTRRVLRPDDDSVQIHRSHGLDRQVEVLRDAIAGLLAGDPTLEPRDVVVICADIEAAGPFVAAGFGASPESGLRHPAHDFRVQVADLSTAQVNPLVPLLLTVLQLGDTRVEASALVDLCAEPAIARRFGFGPDTHDRIAELVGRAGVRWGLNAAHRGGFGMGAFRQNTWHAGIQRLLLGVALSERDLVSVQTTMPVDDVDSSDVELLGGLAELVGRLGRLASEFESPTSLAGWLGRCRHALDLLVSVPASEEWQLGDVLAGLGRMEGRADAACQTSLTASAAHRIVSEEFHQHPARVGFGTGSLVACGMTALRRVPHRVVCLLGWESGRYPRRQVRHGDDLLSADPRPGDPNPTLADRQALLDAIHAAREHLVIVYRGRSESTNEEIPAPTPLAELIEAIDLSARTADGLPASSRVVVSHPLQPFDSSYFDGRGPRSFDPVGLAGARAAAGPRRASPDPYHLDLLPEADVEGGIGLEDLVSFYSHPARFLLRTRAGLSLGEAQPMSDAIPIELDHLERWRVGSRLLGLARGDFDWDGLTRAELLRGTTPPGVLGRRALEGVIDDVEAVLRRLPGEAAAKPVHRDLEVSLPASRLTGRVATHAGVLLATEFSSLQSRHKLAAWIKLVTICAAESGAWKAVVVTKKGTAVLRGPEPEVARGVLATLVDIYRYGLRRPLPMPPRVCETYAALRSAGRDPGDAILRQRLEKQWGFDCDASWAAFFELDRLLSAPAQGTPFRYRDEDSLLGTLARLVWGPLLSHGDAR